MKSKFLSALEIIGLVWNNIFNEKSNTAANNHTNT